MKNSTYMEGLDFAHAMSQKTTCDGVLKYNNKLIILRFFFSIFFNSLGGGLGLEDKDIRELCLLLQNNKSVKKL